MSICDSKMVWNENFMKKVSQNQAFCPVLFKLEKSDLIINYHEWVVS